MGTLYKTSFNNFFVKLSLGNTKESGILFNTPTINTLSLFCGTSYLEASKHL